MKAQFLNYTEDVDWLKDTALKGVHLSKPWSEFKSFVIEGNEDAPNAVNLYLDKNPWRYADYFRVSFNHSPPIYCSACEYSGDTDKPKGGLTPI